MEWKKAISHPEDKIEIPKTWLFIYYYELLTLLFRIENALRIFVYIVLKTNFKADWKDTQIQPEDSNNKTIESLARQRKAQAKNFGYLSYNVACPLMYVTTGELIQLITSEAYWKYFADYFLGNKTTIKNKLEEISNIRNSLAHFRPIKQDDVETIKQNSKHVFSKIESCIYDMLKCSNIVPSNTQDTWYKSLNTLSSELITVEYKESGDKKWIKISLKYNPIVLENRTLGPDFYEYKVLNLISRAVLKKSPTLTKYIILLSEQVPYTTMGDNQLPNYQKIVHLYFNHGILKKNYSQIKKELSKILNIISQEVDQIQKDNLAKGEIMEAVDSFAFLEKNKNNNWWRINIDSLKSTIKEEDEVEYWGSFSTYDPNFFSNIDSYPWMANAISDTDFPF